MTYKVVFTDNVPRTLDIEREILTEIDAEVVNAEASEQTVEELVVDADAIISSHQTVDATLMDRMPNCQVVSRTGIGVDYVDLEAATERGIVVTNVPDHCISEVSDHTLGLMLAVQRRIVESDSEVREGHWNRTTKSIHRIDGQVLGVVGFGQTGQELGRKAQALGMDVLTTQYPEPALAEEHGVERVPLDDLLALSDVVSLHTPLTDETAKMIGSRELEVMKESAILINTARGGLIDQPALARALEDGTIGGAGLDVLTEEPPSSDDSLLDEPSVVLTPHMAYYSQESLRELRHRVAQNVRTVLDGEVPEHVVNTRVLEELPL
ncbi:MULTISPECIES: C-terminal binding protein [Salinibaculum]|uniref:C-terminal binding protein n=1 Tax=Salinibaculum TaxID=2732368 RepID=UPI0030D2B453